MSTPTVSWDETSPSGLQDKSLGAVRIREMKKQVREICGVDHVFQSSGNSSIWGRHIKVSFRSATAPVPLVNSGALYVSDSTGLHWIDEALTDTQLTSDIGFIGGIFGEVRMYSGTTSSIPNGWLLCDGVSTTPNLVGKFIRGINTAATAPGGTGGADTFYLSEAQIPAHTHSLTGGAHTHGSVKVTIPLNTTPTTVVTLSGDFGMHNINTLADDGLHTHTMLGTTEPIYALSNIPAYYELMFIKKVT